MRQAGRRHVLPFPALYAQGQERIAIHLIQIDGYPRPAQAKNIAIAFVRVNPIKNNTL
jgi:hypothetical protein